MFSDLLLVGFESIHLEDYLYHCQPDAPAALSRSMKELLHLMGRLTGRHKGVIYSIDSNSDQSIILTASDDRSIVIWRRKNSIDPAASSESDSPRLLTYEAQCQLYGHESRVWSVRLSPSSDLFYSAGEDCALITWSTCDGQLLRKETRHIGRHIWCLAVDSSGSKLATGGNDGALICSEVSDRKQTTESCRLVMKEKDFLRFAFFDSFSNLIALTNDGFLLRGSIAEQPQPTLRPVEVAGLPRQQESASPLRRCSCARMSPNRRVLLCAEESTPLEQGAGAACCLIDVSNTLDGNDPCRIIWRSGQLSMPDSSDEANSIKTIGGLLNLCWISDHAFIVSAVHDKLILGLLKFDSSIESPISKGASDSSNSCPATVNTEPVSLSASGFEWINCGQLSCIGSQAVMILGDRSGRLHCLVQNLETKRWQRVHSSRQAHKSGVLHLETMSLDSADEARRSIRLLSCGKDGSLIGWRVALVTDDHKDGSVGGFIQESIVKEPGQMRWIERTVQIGNHFSDAQQLAETKLLGFHGRLFKLLDAATLTVEFSADCGGGHRCWDFLTQFDNGSSGLAGAYRLCYVKSGSLLLVTQAMRASYQIKKGLHGGTINCAVVLTTDARGQALVATGSEDCAICTVACPTSTAASADHPSAIAPLSRCRGHASSVRCLATSQLAPTAPIGNNSLAVISGGGRGGLAAWNSTYNYRLLSPETTCQLTDYRMQRDLRHQDPSAELDSTRVMSLAPLTLQLNDDRLFAVACSNGDVLLMKLGSDSGRSRFSLIRRLISVDSGCVLRVIALSGGGIKSDEDKPSILSDHRFACSASDGALLWLSCSINSANLSVSSVTTQLVVRLSCSINDVCQPGCDSLLFLALDSGLVGVCRFSATTGEAAKVLQSSVGHSASTLSVAPVPAAASASTRRLVSLGADCCVRVWLFQETDGDRVDCLAECRLALTDPQRLMLLVTDTGVDGEQDFTLLTVGQGLQAIRVYA
ncbi:hypothetical protein BOX15_Mlig014919g1 [Macrostomum lignano]|uniref:tRNA (34-2'-O)-methyltransferase regulator WDR6 n=1 Tax=Macrostomum lignano TaxID=282301 RepID=A0A267EYA5_9PLAT|nr:hypothetical protein BOX15_Mlig014919g1 [Macrostomum lignano]